MIKLFKKDIHNAKNIGSKGTLACCDKPAVNRWSIPSSARVLERPAGGGVGGSVITITD